MKKWKTVREYIEKNFTTDVDDISKIISELKKDYTIDGTDASFISDEMVAKVASKFKKRIGTEIPAEEPKIVKPKIRKIKAKVGLFGKIKKFFGK